MERDPSNHNLEVCKIWEIPWTLEDMQKSSTNWSLAADSGLFLFLRDFSQRMLSKTHEIEKQLDGLIQDTKATNSRLHTVFNDFLMLSNTQFIENRVYDEEIEDPTLKLETTEQEKTRAQKEAELIPKVQEAVNFGLKVLESAFEMLDIKAGNSESEDEEVAEKVEAILEPKDLYLDRPLPYLIGSCAFTDQDDVGLGDLSSDDMSISSEQGSLIESEADEQDEPNTLNEYLYQDVEVHEDLKKLYAASDDETDEEDNDSDIFVGTDKDEEELRKDSGLPSFADELAARIKGETLDKQEADHSLEDNADELFKPSEKEEEEYSPFCGKGGLFGGGKGLFDDDIEEDLFSKATKPRPAVNGNTVPQTRDNTVFGSSKVSLESNIRKASSVASIQDAPNSSLFDEDDLFSVKTLNKSMSGHEKKTAKLTVDLFVEDDDDEEENEAIYKGNLSEVVPPNGKRTKGKEEICPSDKKIFPSETAREPKPVSHHKPSNTLSLFNDDEEEEDLFSSKPKSKTTRVKKKIVQPKKPGAGSLFSDDEDQWMSSKPSKESSDVKVDRVSAPSSHPGVKVHYKAKDDNEDLFTASNQFSNQYSSQRAALLFEVEDDDEQPLFSIKTPKEQKSGRTAEVKKLVETKDSSGGSIKAKKKTTGAVSLFGGIDDLGDNQGTSGENLPPMVNKAKKRALSLFEDNSNNGKEEDNTEQIPPRTEPSKPSEKNELKDHGSRLTSTGVFQDEEFLFSQTQQRDNNPDVDLFASSRKMGAPSRSSVKAPPHIIFGNDYEEDEELFSSSPSKAPLACLAVNPASLLPGAVSQNLKPGRVPAAMSLPATGGTLDSQKAIEQVVTFDSPAQVSTLWNVNKGRAKGPVQRRPQTRAARHLAAHLSEEAVVQSVPAASSLFSKHEDDLFVTVKPRPVQKLKQTSLLEDDAEDIFGAGNRFDQKNLTSEQADIFQDELKKHGKNQKRLKEVSLESSLFDDNLDIFAELADTTMLKEKKKKKKWETKSIFDDNSG